MARRETRITSPAPLIGSKQQYPATATEPRPTHAEGIATSLLWNIITKPDKALQSAPRSGDGTSGRVSLVVKRNTYESDRMDRIRTTGRP
jgi:hypothetical protein